MGFKAVGLDGTVVLFGDDALRHKIDVAAQKRIKDPLIRKKIVKDILSHEFLYFDRRSLAEEHLNHERAKKCLERRCELKAALDTKAISFLGLDGCSEPTKLTSDKLTGHSAKYLDIDENWLLLSIERHPRGGKAPVIVQYWLYSRSGKTLRLLQKQEEEQAVTGGMLVLKNGNWAPVNNSRVDAFFNQVESFFGPELRRAIERSFHPQESVVIAHTIIPKEVNEEIRSLTDTDLCKRERDAAQQRELEYQAKWGSAEQRNTPQGLFLIPQIRLGFAKEVNLY